VKRETTFANPMSGFDYEDLSDVVDAMDRDANHVYQYLLNELGTSGTREQTRIMLKGRVPPKRIKEKLVSYVKTFILCNQCRAPDTRFIKEDRTTLLKCQACGATRPVRL
jgi:translation initiation factor 2 subunit 2